jgi:acyl transferase domain-containing protein
MRLCRCVDSSDSELLPTATCQLSLFVASYIAMRVYCEAHSVLPLSVAAVAGLSLGNYLPTTFFLKSSQATDFPTRALGDIFCISLARTPRVVFNGCQPGELTASCAAGAFSFEDGIKLVKARGSAMADAAAENKGGMIAVTSPAAGHQVIRTEFGSKLTPANVLSEGTIVYAGSASDCDRLLAFCDEFMKRGQVRSRASRVAVAGAFHTHMMQVRYPSRAVLFFVA